MPTTVQQVETLPEGLVTLEDVNPKVPLIETAQTETPKEEVVEAKTEETTTPETKPTETTEDASATVVDVNLFETPKHVVNCSEKFDKVTIDVNIVKEKVASAQRCYIMTVHDIGYDNSQFDKFINCPEMNELRNRTVWLNVTLPGQEIEAAEMTVQKYPTLEELADELVTVLDYFKLPQVVLLGEGVGATICAHFAMKYPNKCYGLMCIEPIVSSASYIESFKYKLQNLSLSRQSLLSGKEKKAVDQASETAVQDVTNENESFHLQPVDKTTHEKFKNRNFKNMSLFAEAFLNRTNLIGNISKLECDTLIATNKKSTGYTDSKKFFRAINECYRKNCRSLVNVPFIEVEAGTGRLLENSTEQFAMSLQYFLQGIGLLSAMPLKMSFTRQSSTNETVVEEAKTEEVTTEAPATVTETTTETPVVAETKTE